MSKPVVKCIPNYNYIPTAFYCSVSVKKIPFAWVNSDNVGIFSTRFELLHSQISYKQMEPTMQYQYNVI